jgi:TRAP-type transport system small permease protein
MDTFVSTLSRKIDRFSKVMMIALFMAAFIVTVYQVFSRFVLQSALVRNSLPMIDFTRFNLTWGEEMIRYLFVWIVFLGIGIMYKTKGHAQVEILYHYLSDKYKVVLSYVVESINTLLFLFLILFGSRILAFTSQQISPAMGINMTLIYSTVLVCSVFCLVHCLANFVEMKQRNSKKDGEIKAEEVQHQQSNIG